MIEETERILQKKYELTGGDIRAIAEGFASLVGLYVNLENTKDLREKQKIALKIINEALPFYREHMPQEVQDITRQLVNPGILEQTCQELLSGYVEE